MRWTSLLLAACMGSRLPAGPAVVVSPGAEAPQAGWTPDAEARLDDFFAGLEKDSARRVAVFDWDNTMAKHDVGDAVFSYMWRHDQIVAPADWGASGLLSPAALAALRSTCQPGPLRTRDTECGAELASLTQTHRTAAGAPGFVVAANARRMQPAYAFVATLLAGYTETQVAAIADATIAEALAAPLANTHSLRGHAVPAALRLYAPMVALMRRLEAVGVEVWIVSASAEPIVEVFARRARVPPERVVGVRLQHDDDGLLLPRVVPCGGDATSIPYMDGKRCWINQAVWGVSGPAAWLPATQRVILAAGDADTDATFLADAVFRVVIDCHKLEITCRARAGNWLVQPMFINPMPGGSEFDCSAPCLRPDGTRGPC